MKMTWKNAILSLFLFLIVGTGFYFYERPADELNVKVCNRFFCQDKEVAFTFDDGPHPVTTPLLLGILKHYNANATFFVVGERAHQYPSLVKRIHDEGHQIADHTYSHQNLTRMSGRDVDNEITEWDQTMAGMHEEESCFVRPPGGDYNREAIHVFKHRGKILSLWSVNPGDWKVVASSNVVNRVENRMDPGMIVLMHDEGMQTVRALPSILDTLKKKGYRFVTLEQIVH